MSQESLTLFSGVALVVLILFLMWRFRGAGGPEASALEGNGRRRTSREGEPVGNEGLGTDSPEE